MASNVNVGNRSVVWNPDKRTAPQPPQSGTTSTGSTAGSSSIGNSSGSERADTTHGNLQRNHQRSEYQSSFVDNRSWVHNSHNLHNCINMEQNNEESDSRVSARGNSNLHESVGQTSGTPSQSNVTVEGSASLAQPREVVGELNLGSDPTVRTDISQESANNENMAPRHPIQTQDVDIGVTSGRQQEMRQEPLPDLLHSHVIPSQSSNPSWQGGGHSHPSGQDPRGYTHHPHHHRHHSRHHHRSGHRSHHSRRRHRSRSSSATEPEPCKEGCLSCLAATTSFRWILVILSLLGVCCVVTGIVLAALHATGNSFLFLAIMFIGLGVLLVVVVAVGWKCTPRGHEPLHALFGLGDFRHQERRSRSRRHGRSSRAREQQWYGGVMYPEFQYRRPPPSYNASMQDFQHQLALAQSQREQFHATEELPAEDYSLPSSPPPSYRSRASTVRTGIQITFPPTQGENSRPPTYRSHASTQGHTAHQRPSLPEDYLQQGSDVAFTGHYTGNSQQHSRNSSAGNFRIHSRSNSSTDRNVVSTVVEPQGGGSVAVSVSVVSSSSQDQLLDSAVEQTLQTLDAVTGADNPAQETTEDIYPMFTPL